MPDFRKQTGVRTGTQGQFTKPGVQYPTPDTEEYLIIERKTVDSKDRPTRYGTPHRDHPNAVLISQRFEAEEDGKKTRLQIYAKRGATTAQDAYNAAQSFSGDSNSHRVLIRNYYLPAPVEELPKGTPDSEFSECLLTSEQHAPRGGEDNAHILVTRVYEALPGPWLPFTRYDDDLGPVQGRRRAVVNTGQESSQTATTLTNYESRDGSSYVSWEIEEAWSDGSGNTGNPPFPIKVRDFYEPSRGSVQEERVTQARTGAETASITESGGTVTQIDYDPHPTNAHLIYKVTTIYTVPTAVLVGKQTTGDGQLATVTTTRKAVVGYIPPAPSALQEVQVEQPDHATVIEKTTLVPEVFAAPAFSASKDDLTPAKFRAAVTETTTEQTVAGTAAMPTLGIGETAKSEQQQTKFIKRTRTTSRNTLTTATLSGQQLVSQYGGGVADVTETLATGGQSISPNLKTLAASVDSLGDGRTVKAQIEVSGPAWPVLQGAEYDEVLGVKLPFTTQVVPAGQTGGADSQATPIDYLRTQIKTVEKSAAITALSAIHTIFNSQDQIALPDILTSAKVYWNESVATGAPERELKRYSLSGSVGVTGALDYQIKSGFRGNVPSEIHMFYLPMDAVTSGIIATKVDALPWPIVQPESATVIIFGETVSVRVDVGGYFVLNLWVPVRISTSKSKSTGVQITRIPPTLHGVIPIATPTKTLTETATGGPYSQVTVTAEGTSSITSIPATSPALFPEGRYILQANAAPYKYGMARVTVVVVDVPEFS
jgi:hypothetical protein